MNISEFKTAFTSAVERFDLDVFKKASDWTDNEIMSTLVDIGLSAWEEHKDTHSIGKATDGGLQCIVTDDCIELQYIVAYIKIAVDRDLPF